MHRTQPLHARPARHPAGGSGPGIDRIVRPSTGSGPELVEGIIKNHVNPVNPWPRPVPIQSGLGCIARTYK